MTPDEAYAEARRRIAEAKANLARLLDLGDLGLARIPPEIGELDTLSVLALGRFKVKEGANGVEWEYDGDRPVPRLTSVEPLRELKGLAHLGLRWCDQLKDVEPLRELKGLAHLGLRWCDQLKDVEPLRELKGLAHLDLGWCKQLTSVEPLRELKGLAHLDLSYCRQLKDVEPLRELKGLAHLDLNSCGQLTSVEPLRELKALAHLGLSGCEQLTSVEPLRELKALAHLGLSGCDQLKDVEPLRELKALAHLDLSGCKQLKVVAPIRTLLIHLTELKLHGCSFTDLDPPLCGDLNENVRDNIVAHFADVEFQSGADTELKLFILGNGGVGKTQLRRRLCGLDFDESIDSTHGVEVERFSLVVGKQTIHLNVWDFGGQDVYHGTHALFLQEHAVYVVLWHPDLETGTTVTPDGSVFQNRPLPYWLDFVRNVAGTEAPVLVVQSKFDDQNAVPVSRQADLSDFKFKLPREVQASAKQEDGLERLLPELKRSVRYLLDQRPIPSIGAGRVRVRDQLRQWRQQHPTIPWQSFLELCDEGNGDVYSPEALADFLHRSGFLFYDPRLFHDEHGRPLIILDQGWALKPIYAVLHRKHCLSQLQNKRGRFTLKDLGYWLWNSEKRSQADQELFLKRMLSCGICFPTCKLSGKGEYPEVWEYASPDHLPTLEKFQEDAIDLPDPNTATLAVTVSLPFLHDGLLRTLLARIGEIGRSAAEYWRYGCYFRPQGSNTKVRFDSTTTPEGPSAAGSITFSAWGEHAGDILQQLLNEVQRLSPRHQLEPDWGRSTAPAGHGRSEHGPARRQRGSVPPRQLEEREERLLDLMERWCELTSQGKSVTLAELCSDCPEMIPELEHLLRLERGLVRVAAIQPVPGPPVSRERPRPLIANYDILEFVNHGGMGEVWRAREQPLGRIVALKLIRDGLAGPRERTAFEKEARAMAALNHEHIVRVYAVGRWYSEERKRELPFLSMEFIHGQTLDDRLGYLRPLPTDAARLVLLLAQAIQHAHERGVLHLDLKPGNVMLEAPSMTRELNCAWGLPKLTDFGLAALRGSSASGGDSPLSRCTPQYAAPEQADGKGGPKVDVYGLGGILYWLLTGHHPFDGDNTDEILEKVRNQPPIPPRELEKVPDTLNALCLRCLAKMARERPTILELIRDLARYLDDNLPELVPTAHPRPLPPGVPQGLEGLRIEDRRVFISYPWGTPDDEGRQHEAFVNRLCAAVDSWGYDLIRDRRRMQGGDSIREFMARSARAPRVILLLNKKYLESEFCVWELEEVYRCCYRDRDFQQRIIPATLPGARVFTIEDRLDAADHWARRAARLRQRGSPLRGADQVLVERMEEWARNLSNILADVADLLHPVGHEAIESNDFRMLRGMLERGRDAR